MAEVNGVSFTGGGSGVQGSVEMNTTKKTEKMNFNPDDPSPRDAIETPTSITDRDSSGASSSNPSPNSTEESSPDKAVNGDSNGSQWKTMMNSIKKKSARRFSVIPLLTNELMAMKSLKKFVKTKESADIVGDCEAVLACKPSWRNFDSAELASATNDFSSENLIGEGGNAKVYKGCLSDGQVIAVKKLKKTEEEQDRVVDFLSELGVIAHVDHPNAAKLLGFSIDNGLHLVLEYLPNGCLTSVLHGERNHLDWKKRFRVAIGIAQGLEYLHHDCPRRIIHRDIKASNILLDEDFEAKLSDFGIAKWLPENWVDHVIHPIEGTFGYLAPEYFMHGIVAEKTDVFAFGVLLLEIITGRHAIDSSRQNLVMWAKPLLEACNKKELIDPRIGDNYNPTELKRAMLAASMCIHHLASMRPHMNRVVRILKGEDVPMDMVLKTASGRAVIIDGCDLKDYTCTNYLDDLNRHKELVME